MLLKVLPTREFDTVMFRLTLPQLPEALAYPNNFNLQIQRLMASGFGMPRSVYAFDKSVWFVAIVKEIVFCLETRIVHCLLIDGTTEAWSLEDHYNGLGVPQLTCLQALESVIDDVSYAGQLDWEAKKELEKAIAPTDDQKFPARLQSRSFTEPPSPTSPSSSKAKQRRSLTKSTLLAFITSFVPTSPTKTSRNKPFLSRISSSLSVPSSSITPSSPTSDTSEYSQDNSSPRTSKEPDYATRKRHDVSPIQLKRDGRFYRLRARSTLVNTFRRYILPELSRRLQKAATITLSDPDTNSAAPHLGFNFDASLGLESEIMESLGWDYEMWVAQSSYRATKDQMFETMRRIAALKPEALSMFGIHMHGSMGYSHRNSVSFGTVSSRIWNQADKEADHLSRRPSTISGTTSRISSDSSITASKISSSEISEVSTTSVSFADDDPVISDGVDVNGQEAGSPSTPLELTPIIIEPDMEDDSKTETDESSLHTPQPSIMEGIVNINNSDDPEDSEPSAPPLYSPNEGLTEHILNHFVSPPEGPKVLDMDDLPRSPSPPLESPVASPLRYSEELSRPPPRPIVQNRNSSSSSTDSMRPVQHLLADYAALQDQANRLRSLLSRYGVAAKLAYVDRQHIMRTIELRGLRKVWLGGGRVKGCYGYTMRVSGVEGLGALGAVAIRSPLGTNKPIVPVVVDETASFAAVEGIHGVFRERGRPKSRGDSSATSSDRDCSELGNSGGVSKLFSIRELLIGELSDSHVHDVHDTDEDGQVRRIHSSRPRTPRRITVNTITGQVVESTNDHDRMDSSMPLVFTHTPSGFQDSTWSDNNTSSDSDGSQIRSASAEVSVPFSVFQAPESPIKQHEAVQSVVPFPALDEDEDGTSVVLENRDTDIVMSESF